MSSIDYVLGRIRAHRVCGKYGWDPYIILGFAKVVETLTDGVSDGNGHVSLKKADGGSINLSRRADKSGKKATA